ncbi:MAG: phosphoribosylanthranilate isomerase [Lachnospiraceae bacterium]|nr:phosphoribosylanthranilate isomerase [Lachnospiraceae bacterium]
MRVKICGIKNIEDGLKAVEFGADAIGLLVGQEHNSKDFISISTAKEIVNKMPPFVSTVLVTHINNAELIIDMIKKIGVNTVQLHSDIGIVEINKIKENCPNVKLIKLVHIIGEKSIDEVKVYSNIVDAILLDTINYATNQVGGTGQTHNWDIDKQIVKETNANIIVAGGLNKDNVKEAILKIKPFGVDVNSGVQNEIGFKDYDKLKEFINNAKSK